MKHRAIVVAWVLALSACVDSSDDSTPDPGNGSLHVGQGDSKRVVLAPPIRFESGERFLFVGDTVSSPVLVDSSTISANDYTITYTTSDSAVVTVDGQASVSALGPGFATLTATLETVSGDTSQVTQMTMVSFVATAWVGTDDTELVFDDGVAGVTMYRSSDPDCDIANISSCEEGQSDVLVPDQGYVDSAMTLDRPGYYTYAHSGEQYRIPMSLTELPLTTKHGGVVWRNKIWIVGGTRIDYGTAVHSSQDGQNWIRETADGGFPGRSTHTLAVFDDKLWMIGGRAFTGENLADVWRSDDGVNWTQMSAPPFSPRKGGSLVAFEGRLYLAGGFDTAELSDVWSTANGTDWTLETADAGWKASGDLQLLSFAGKLWWIGAGDSGMETWSSADGAQWALESDSVALPLRTGHGATVFEGKMWVVGGFSDNQEYLSDVWSSSDGITWTLEADAPGFARRSYPSVLAFDNRLWVVLGADDRGVRNNAWSSLDGGTWRLETSAAGFAGRSLHGVVSFAGKLWVYPGYGDEASVITDAWASDDGGTTWVKQAEAPALPARIGATYTVYNNKLWMIGGYDASFTTTSTVYSSDDGISWTLEAAAPFPARFAHSTVVLGTTIWVIGGSRFGGRHADIWASDDGVTWTERVSVAPFGARAGAAAVVYDGAIWLVGGGDSTLRNDVWTSSNGIEWSEVVTDGGFPARQLHALVATADKLVLIGGLSSQVLSDVWSSTNGVTWVQETADAAFAGRSYAGAAVHDGYLFVVGGSTNTTVTQNANDVWRSVDGVDWRRGHRSMITF